ncbi:MAG TPA: alpha/beta hydrolase [Acidimicrobiales bacterium]|nr:alpha/beta hydrolase [Acidimicrobiales bacterium]
MSIPSSRVTAADGVAVAVHDLGGSGPPVVLAHATGLHGLVWRALAAQLADAFACTSFDERGHGDSGLPQDLDFDWRGFALDILAVVDRRPLRSGPASRRSPPFAVGHSSGATALLLAEQARPGTFRAMYCYEPVVIPADPPLGRDIGNWLAAGARRRREVFASRKEARAHYRGKPPFDRWAPEALADYVEHGFADQPDGSVRLKCRGEHEALVYEMASAHDGFGRMAEVRCPVLVARGGDTEAMSPPALDGLVERLPDARAETLPGLGHFGPLEDPATVAKSIRAFFA